MMSKKLFRWMHKIALFAIVFASIAPSISHALAAQQGINTFVQAVCTSDGRIVTVQQVTTKGQQLEAGFEIKSEAKSQPPVSIALHINHCPFCSVGVADVVIPSHSPAFKFYLENIASQWHEDVQPAFISNDTLSANLTRAPPVLSL